MQLDARLQVDVERAHVELVGKYLNDALHEVLLRYLVLAVDHLLEQLGQHQRAVRVHVDRVELREAHQVGADEQAELAALLFALLLLTRVALILHAHPELVHLGEVEQDEVNRVVDVTILSGGKTTTMKQLVLNE